MSATIKRLLSRHAFAPDPLNPTECKWCGRHKNAHPE